MKKFHLEMGEGILQLQEKIGVKKEFFHYLLEEDDWSFVIKLHALFEAVCSHLLLYHFNEPNLTDVINFLDISGKSTSKIVFLYKLGLLSKPNKRFIHSLSELRNRLVHNVRNSEFVLKNMVQSLDKQALQQFAVTFSPSESLMREFETKLKLKKGLDIKIRAQSQIANVIISAKENPKLHIWLGAYSVLNSLIDMYDYSDVKPWEKVTNQFDKEEE